MAETLGSLCDKLTVVKLKQYHSDNPERLESLTRQETQLKAEIDEFMSAAVTGAIPPERLMFAANKVYKAEGNTFADIGGGMGDVLSQLADVNCKIWHEQEKVYDFEKVPVPEKDKVIKNLAVLNLMRNKCIETIDRTLAESVGSKKRRRTSGPPR